jgi:hypothetical protein
MDSTSEVELEVRRAARLIGTAHGTSQVAATGFLGLLVTRIAADLHASEGHVKGAAVLGLFTVMALTLVLVLSRRGDARKGFAAAGFAAAAVGLLAIALRPWSAVLYGGMILAALPTLTLTPIRTATARAFRRHQRDGSFTGHSRAWSYAVRAGLTAGIAGVAFLLPEGWRIATAGLGLWLAGVGATLWRARLPVEPRPEGRISLWQVWDQVRATELRSSLLALACSNFVLELVLLSLEPFLAGAGLHGRATLAVGLLGFLPLASLPMVRRFGELSNDRVWRAGTLAARFLLVSGGLVLGTLAPLPLWLVVLVTVAALAGVEFGVGPLNDSARTYASRQGFAADALATFCTAAAYYAGGQVAQLSSTAGWGLVVAGWASAAVLAVLLLRRHERRPKDPWLRVLRPRTPEVGLTLGRLTGTDARVRLWFDVGPIRSYTTVKEGDLLRLTTPLDTGAESPPDVTVFEVSFRAAWRPRPPRRRRGRLYPGARFACVAEDGRQFGVGVWWGGRGRWEIADGRTRLISQSLLRPLSVTPFEHNV